MSKVLLKMLFSVAFVALSSQVSANEVEPIYGSQLMTQKERMAHQQAMRNAKTPEERALIRQRHHEKMRLRAKEKGITLPANPPAERGRINQQDRPGMGKGYVN